MAAIEDDKDGNKISFEMYFQGKKHVPRLHGGATQSTETSKMADGAGCIVISYVFAGSVR